ncbi:type VI secretion system baseplate subunit TssG [Xanthovirga aplysinae]|uniref:type VI secretion system baseplate subunit TssG n=1 Tax=Xanthovirga aplysinae TaxID=2529853 RepID=UPI0012BC50A0|nr:type VI secretion system baseplate subunit TssG [Xanthovirga aplysinae]MTI31963.1 hypothetical protein [Xanthovirga aplysinae]
MTVDEVVNKVQAIQGTEFDVRVEILVANMLDQGVDPEEIMFFFEGVFNRNFRKDLLDVELIFNEYEKSDNIGLKLSRDGLYHTLPEALFHQSLKPPVKGTKQLAEDYKRRKEEEGEAKKFFAPFENEFLLHRVFQEQEEKRFLAGLNNTKVDDFFMDFWDIEKDLPVEMTSKMVQLLPWAWKIAGDLELFVRCLRLVMGEEVSLKEIGYERMSQDQQQMSLGEVRLGLEFISGHSFMDDTYSVEVVIGPVPNEHTCKYLKGGEYQRFLEVFYSFFLPLEVAATTKVMIEEEESKFQLSNENFSARLGWTTTL